MKTALAGGGVREGRGQVRDNILQLVGEMPAAVVVNCMVEQTIDLTHQVKNKLESVDLVKDAKDLQKTEEEKDNEFLSSVRREVGQFYKRHVTSQMATTNLTASIATWEEKVDMARERLGGMGEVGREEEAKAMLKGMVASYRTSLDTLKSNIASMEMTANKHPLVDTVRNQQDQIEELGQIISALISNNSVSSLKSSQATTLGSCPTSNLASTMVGGTACSTPVRPATWP